jgi:MFS family permease
MGEFLFMVENEGKANIFKAFKTLKGNTRISVIFEPMFGIPFALFNFYLSLYMKSQGISNKQIGYLIAINFIFSAVFSLFGGVISDHLGRKKATLIFDFISWPLALLLYAISNSFWMFAIGMFMTSFGKIVAVSWNLMVVEDADHKQRVAAYNMLNIINLSTGVITPIAGILVATIGISSAERIFLIFAAISMSTMILLRNHFYVETKVGQEILDSKVKFNIREIFKNGIYAGAIQAIFKRKEILLLLSVYVLFTVYAPIGTFFSLYYAPYMNEVLGIQKSALSILGGVNSAVMLIVFAFVIPVISRFNLVLNMIIGTIVQAAALFMLIVIPKNNFTITIFCVVTFAVGFSLFRAFNDSILAEVTDGKERAGIYSMLNTVISILSALAGLASGYLYAYNPRSIYVLSIGILLISCIFLILFFIIAENNKKLPITKVEES